MSNTLQDFSLNVSGIGKSEVNIFKSKYIKFENILKELIKDSGLFIQVNKFNIYQSKYSRLTLGFAFPDWRFFKIEILPVITAHLPMRTDL
jgi:hypothetical protein